MATMHEDFARGQSIKVSSNRAFGWVFVVVFLIIGLWPLVLGDALRAWSLIVGALVAMVTIVAPALLTIPNKLWQRFGLLLHRVVSPIMLAIMFFLVITPMGLLKRIFARHNVRLRRDAALESYWIKREPPGPKPDTMPRQF